MAFRQYSQPPLKQIKSLSRRQQHTEKLRQQSEQIVKKFHEIQQQNYQKFKRIKDKAMHISYIDSSIDNGNKYMTKNHSINPSLNNSISSRQLYPKSIHIRNLHQNNRQINSVNLMNMQHERSQQILKSRMIDRQNTIQNIKAMVQIALSQHQNYIYRYFSGILKKISQLYKKIDNAHCIVEQLAEFQKYSRETKQKKQMLKNKYRNNVQIQNNQIEKYRTQNQQYRTQNNIIKLQLNQLKKFREQDSQRISEIVEQLTKKQAEIQCLQNQLKMTKNKNMQLEKKKEQQKQLFLKRIDIMTTDNKKLHDKFVQLQKQAQKSDESKIQDYYLYEQSQKQNKANKQYQLIQKQLQEQIQNMHKSNNRLNQQINELTQKNYQLQNNVLELSLKQKAIRQQIHEQTLNSQTNEEMYLKKQIGQLQKIQKMQKILKQKQNQLSNIEHQHKKTLSTISQFLQTIKKQVPALIHKNSSQSQFNHISADHKYYEKSIIKNIMKNLQTIKNVQETSATNQQQIRNLLSEFFAIQNLQVQLKGYDVIFREIRETINNKNRKIQQLQSENFRLQKQLKKAIISNNNPPNKQSQRQNIRKSSKSQKALQSHRNSSAQKDRSSNNNTQYIKFQQDILQKNQIIANLNKQLELAQSEFKTWKQKLQTQNHSLMAQINMLRNNINELNEQLHGLNKQTQQYLEQIERLKKRNKQIKQQIEQLRKANDKKQLQYRRQNIKSVSNLKNQENKTKKLQNQLQSQREDKVNIQKYYQNILSQKNGYIEQISTKLAENRAENKLLNQKINKNLLESTVNSYKNQVAAHSLYITHPHTLNLSFRTQSKISVEELQTNLDRSQQQIIQLQLQKRKLTRLLANAQKGQKGTEPIQQQMIYSKLLQQQKSHEKKIRQNLQNRLKLNQKQKHAIQNRLQLKSERIIELQADLADIIHKQEQHEFKIKEWAIKQLQYQRIIQQLQQKKQAQLSELRQQMLKMTNKKQQQLAQFIEKYNNAKIQMFDELDCKSDKLHNIELEHETHLELLKEQISILQARLAEKQQERLVQKQQARLVKKQQVRLVEKQQARLVQKQQARLVEKQEKTDLKNNNNSLQIKQAQFIDNDPKNQVGQQNNITPHESYDQNIQEIVENYHENYQQDLGQLRKTQGNNYKVQRRSEPSPNMIRQQQDDDYDIQQLADEVEDLDFYSPLQKRIIIEEDEDEPIQQKPVGFSLGLMQMMGDENCNEQVIEPDD